jgi:hypothetical protein
MMKVPTERVRQRGLRRSNITRSRQRNQVMMACGGEEHLISIPE